MVSDTPLRKPRAPGAGRPKSGVTKTSRQITLDIDLVKWATDSVGGKLSPLVNKALRQYKDRQQQ